MSSNKKNILVVDDDRSILGVIKMILKHSGFSVRSTEDGREVFNILENELFDLVVLDMFLEGSDGRDIAKSLKKEEKTKKIPLVMISAHTGAEQECLEAGADEFLAKPFDLKDLLSIIKKHT